MNIASAGNSTTSAQANHAVRPTAPSPTTNTGVKQQIAAITLPAMPAPSSARLFIGLDPSAGNDASEIRQSWFQPFHVRFATAGASRGANMALPTSMASSGDSSKPVESAFSSRHAAKCWAEQKNAITVHSDVEAWPS